MPTPKKRSTSGSSSSKSPSARGSSARGSASKTSSSRGASGRSPASPSSRSRGSSQDAIALLKEDHRKVQKMFKQAQKLDPDEDAEELRQLVQTACQELALHAQLEEELFYPAMAAAADEDDQDLVREATVEHNSAKQLIAELEQMGPDDDSYQATFKVLGEYINHHIDEEENEMFPAARKAKLDLKGIGQEIMQQQEAAGQGQRAPDPGSEQARATKRGGGGRAQAEQEEGEDESSDEKTSSSRH